MQHPPLSRTGLHAMTSPGGTTFNRSGTVKLGPKQLREQILGVLAGDPAKVFSLREIRTAIGRTSGAVPLAVKKLVELGQAEHAGGGYRFAAATGTLPPAAPPTPAPAFAPVRPGPIQ